MSIRIIPRLDIKGGTLVKGINLEGLRILGRADWFARQYYLQGADELLYLDAVASLYGRNSLTDFIRSTAASMFIPLTVGGGLRSLDDVRAVLLAGADKVAINTAALENPALLRQVSETFGASTLVLSLVAKRHADGHYTAFSNNGREDSGREVFEWLEEAVALGIGEVLLTALDREGTGHGYDLELITQIEARCPRPVIACGGASTADDVLQVIEQSGVRAVSLASALHYPLARENIRAGAQQHSGAEFSLIQQSLSRTSVQGTDLHSLRQRLQAQGHSVRPLSSALAVYA